MEREIAISRMGAIFSDLTMKIKKLMTITNDKLLTEPQNKCESYNNINNLIEMLNCLRCHVETRMLL